MECRVCNTDGIKRFFTLDCFPIYIWPISKEKKQEFEKLELYKCHYCGLIQTQKFEEEFIKKLYDRSVFGLIGTDEFPTNIQKNVKFVDYCFKHLGKTCFEGKSIIDIGGYDVLCSLDIVYKQGVICDPNAPEKSNRSNLRIQRNFFSAENFQTNQFDVVIAKHILEHIDDLQQFMKDIRHVLRDSGFLVIETPNFEFLFERKSHNLFYHQHITYFEKNSVKNLLNTSGFEILNIELGNNLRLIAKKAEKQNTKPLTNKNIKNTILANYPNLVREHYSRVIERLYEKQFNLHQNICFGAGGATTLLFYWCPEVVKILNGVIDSSIMKIGKKVSNSGFIVEDAREQLPGNFDNVLISSDEFFNEILRWLRKEYYYSNMKYVRLFPDFKIDSLRG